MPRNNSGVYTLPNAPFVPGTVISSSVMNGDLADIAAALTGSIAANGTTPIGAPLKFLAGTAAAPGMTFVTDSTTGVYLAGIGILGLSGGGGGAQVLVDSTQVGAGKNGNQLYYGNGAILAPVGVVHDFAGATPPTGWFLCYGQLLSTTSYPELFNVLGYVYGGSGASFALPDCRGRLTAGLDNMGGTPANRITSFSGIASTTLGASGGSQFIQITAQGQLPNVNFLCTGIAFVDTGHTHNYTAGLNPQALSGGGSSTTTAPQTGTTASNNQVVGHIQDYGGYQGTSNSGGTSAPIPAMNPVIMFNKIIFAGRP